MYNFYFSDSSRNTFPGYVCNFRYLDSFITISGVIIFDGEDFNVLVFRKQLQLNDFNFINSVTDQFKLSKFYNE